VNEPSESRSDGGLLRSGTATPATRVLGLAALAALAATAYLGLVVTPADEVQLDAVRLLYLHVPTAWIAMYVSFGTTSLASLLWLWPRTRSAFWDRLAGASAEVGVLFIGLTLVVGATWGRTTWGVWWTWDARLTITALMFVLYLGYLALRRAPDLPELRARRSAIAALLIFVVVPINHFAVTWWRTLHQESSLSDPRRLGDPHITGSMAWTLLVGVVAFTLAYAWFVAHRSRIAWLEERLDDQGLAEALAERRAEGDLADLGVPS
jgi:heme exporter protein C